MKSCESELRGLTSSLTTVEANKAAEEVAKEIETMEEKLAKLRGELIEWCLKSIKLVK